MSKWRLFLNILFMFNLLLFIILIKDILLGFILGVNLVFVVTLILQEEEVEKKK